MEFRHWDKDSAFVISLDDPKVYAAQCSQPSSQHFGPQLTPESIAKNTLEESRSKIVAKVVETQTKYNEIVYDVGNPWAVSRNLYKQLDESNDGSPVVSYFIAEDDFMGPLHVDQLFGMTNDNDFNDPVQIVVFRSTDPRLVHLLNVYSMVRGHQNVCQILDRFTFTLDYIEHTAIVVPKPEFTLKTFLHKLNEFRVMRVMRSLYEQLLSLIDYLHNYGLRKCH